MRPSPPCNHMGWPIHHQTMQIQGQGLGSGFRVRVLGQGQVCAPRPHTPTCDTTGFSLDALALTALVARALS